MKDNKSAESYPFQAEEQMRELAAQYGVLYLSSVSDEMLDPSLVSELPVEWARANVLLPIRIDGQPYVLTADLDQVSHQEYLSILTGVDLSPVFALPEIIADAINRCYYSRENSPQEFLDDLGVSPASAIVLKGDDLFQVAEKAPVTQLVNLILLEAVKRKASDIHFEPYESKLRVRYRIDGVLYEQSSPPKHLEEALISRLKVMAHMDIAEKRLPQDGMAKVRVGGREIDIRVSTVPVAEGERVVLRLLDQESTLLPLSVLGMPDAVHNSFRNLLGESNGIIIVSGPTGSGKTTTLYAALGQMDSSRKNIITIENPIEYQLPDIGQIQVKPKIGLTFASGLRHILRQDPDIILVGETRDLETADIAVRASLTGHLVLTTLHTNDAAGAVLRMVDMGIEPYLLASCLRGVLAQRLVRKLCPVCMHKSAISPAMAVSLGRHGAKVTGREMWEPVGCPACLEGYSGRLGVFELIVFDDEMQGMIRVGNANSEELCALAEKRGMTTMMDDGISKILSGMTSLSELISVVSHNSSGNTGK